MTRDRSSAVRSRTALARRAVSLVCVAAACFAPVARAADPVPLDRSETTSLVTGKKVTYLRTRDNATVSWDFRSDGTVYYLTPNTVRNTSFSGAWTIDEDGAVCFKWNADKYLQLTDGCVVFRHDGDKTVITGKRTGAVTGTVVDAS